ncbi:MotA/TolQ/ExbB proton channel family protein [Labilithrix luteola]|uniref:MotA/TolQ/ExbB proton channel family protein n=1 Tax=Labilithrix luteola TaxID=1391654 RepID=A0A0K1PR91_9BACT|nr:MotA/TolQ/ExbB proton channel family protein [Labilithrix luteola]AKU96060.1 MotA/TolQ/ExbB proton channel family protein [Labilithrix luteola]
MQIENKLRALAGMGAGWVMWLLLSLSVLILAIAIERAIVLFRSRDDIAKLRRNLASSLGRGDLTAARGLVVASPSVEARVLAAGLGAMPRGPAAVEERLASEAQLAKLSMERRLAILGTIGSNAPFIGLLGTVIGIIRAFHALDASGGQVSTALMSEIGEALTATAVGLFVALPAVALFNFFQKAIASRISMAEALGREMLSYVKDERRALTDEAA